MVPPPPYYGRTVPIKRPRTPPTPHRNPTPWVPPYLRGAIPTANRVTPSTVHLLGTTPLTVKEALKASRILTAAPKMTSEPSCSRSEDYRLGQTGRQIIKNGTANEELEKGKVKEALDETRLYDAPHRKIPKMSSSQISEQPHVLFIGGGNMANFLINGCVNKKFLKQDEIAISVKTENSAEKWRKKGFKHVFTNTQAMMEKYPTAVYIISVKPQIFDEVVKTWAVNTRPKTIISIMAGISLNSLKEHLPFLARTTTFIRLMPNMASAIGESASSMSLDEQTSNQENIAFAVKFAECIGTVEIIPERTFNAAMAIGGSSPAWVFMFIEALADGAVAQGLGRAEAKRIAAQAVMGSAKMLLSPESGFDIEKEHMGILKDKVCSPGGTTIEGVRVLEKNGFRSGVMEAVIACSQKAEDMAQKFKKFQVLRAAISIFLPDN